MAHRVGLVISEPETGAPPILRTATGVATRLSTPGEAAPLRYLNDCVVEVDGWLLFGALQVRDWRVLDAGDGSGNYVGVVRAYGARLVIDDRNSGSTIVLDDQTAAPLRRYVGLPVLVIGHLTGNGYVVPVAFRVLAPHS
ncbi:MAG: hypothetical protein EXR69_01505 [Myxococcales bacterium]|nr:hypothetical protein [Myxococcales bacterium]